MRWWRLTLRSVLVAAIVGFTLPALWFIVTGETRQTPAVEKGIFDRMTEAEIEEWKRANLRSVSFWEHVKATPRYVRLFWPEYLAESALVFMIVLVINGAFFTGRKNEP
jgi:hypothetical protein